LDGGLSASTLVMPDFMSGIHDFVDIRMLFKSWMPATRAGMTLWVKAKIRIKQHILERDVFIWNHIPVLSFSFRMLFL
jgi:hypothetical protein